MIIGFTGQKQNGKSTACNVLIEKGYEVLNFADPLKEIGAELAGAPLFECYDEKSKEAQRSMFVYVEDIKLLMERNNLPFPNVLNNINVLEFQSLRRLLQWVGSELFREADKNFWINKLTDKMIVGKKYVIGDVRFPNEAEAIRRRGGSIVLVKRPGIVSTDTHASEQIQIDADYTIVNTDKSQFIQDVTIIEDLISNS